MTLPPTARHYARTDKMCEDCRKLPARFGLPKEKEGLPKEKEGLLKLRRWCTGCAKGHAGAENYSAKSRRGGTVRTKTGAKFSKTKCEDCGCRGPSFSLPPAKRRRWCAPCAKTHPGAIDRNEKVALCEDCEQAPCKFGLTTDGVKRWCGACAKKHTGAQNLAASTTCEDCGNLRSKFGLPAEGKTRWCSGCAKAHAGAVDMVHKMCEDCKMKQVGRRGRHRM